MLQSVHLEHTPFQKVQEKHLRHLIKKQPNKLSSKLKSVLRFSTNKKNTKSVFDSVGHLGDKSTFTCLC